MKWCVIFSAQQALINKNVEYENQISGIKAQHCPVQICVDVSSVLL